MLDMVFLYDFASDFPGILLAFSTFFYMISRAFPGMMKPPWGLTLKTPPGPSQGTKKHWWPVGAHGTPACYMENHYF